jgi:hypothetical protein
VKQKKEHYKSPLLFYVKTDFERKEIWKL